MTINLFLSRPKCRNKKIWKILIKCKKMLEKLSGSRYNWKMNSKKRNIVTFEALPPRGCDTFPFSRHSPTSGCHIMGALYGNSTLSCHRMGSPYGNSTPSCHRMGLPYGNSTPSCHRMGPPYGNSTPSCHRMGPPYGISIPGNSKTTGRSLPQYSTILYTRILPDPVPVK